MNRRIVNLTRGIWLKSGQAERAVEVCAAVWVEYGVSIRDATLAEAIAARNERARANEPLALAEIYGVVFEPPELATAAFRAEMELAREAGRFAVGSGQPSAANF